MIGAFVSSAVLLAALLLGALLPRVALAMPGLDACIGNVVAGFPQTSKGGVHAGDNDVSP